MPLLSSYQSVRRSRMICVCALVIALALISTGIFARYRNVDMGIFDTQVFAGEKNGNRALISNDKLSNSSNSNTAVLEPDDELDSEATDVTKEVAPIPPPQPAAAVDFDFDGDGSSDLSRWHPSTTEFKIKKSTGGYETHSLGSSSDKLAPADYDADGKTDVATFNAGTWTIRLSASPTPSPTPTTITGFGASGDIPVSGNYRGSAPDELAYYRPSTGYWYWREVSSGTVYSMGWGTSGDIPTPGDYDGDGKMDPAIFRPSTGYWWITLSGTSSSTSAGWGQSGDVPVPADFNGDGMTDLGIFRPSTGMWYIKFSDATTPYATWTTQSWGNYNDQPVAGDFDGDSKADFAIWRPTSGVWYIIMSDDASFYREELGVPGDTAVASSYIKQVGTDVAPDELAMERLSPKNATGGTNIYSKNFAWGRQLVSLPGRSGLDLGMGISYNSRVWTKVDASIVFDADLSNVSPGFRLDFPVIEPAFYDDGPDRYVYTMVTPSGARVQFRQTTVSNIYETVDSSYLQLETENAEDPNDPIEEILLSVLSPDGTRFSYEWNSGAFRCTKIKDRNGNYIEVTYDDYGFLEKAKDTLGREVLVDYDGYGYISALKQNWGPDNGAGTLAYHNYATFSYTTKTIATDFDGLTVWGPTNGMDLRVLQKITYSDGSFTKFHYNGYAQVWKVENHAPNSTDVSSNILNYVATDLDAPTANQEDCPEFTEIIKQAKDFNSGTPITTTIGEDPSDSYTPEGGSSITATRFDITMSGHPNSAVTKVWVGESGWKEGLTLATEDWADSALQRWSWSTYTQDDTGASYITNPRAIESRVGDGTSTRKTTTDYLVYPSTTIAKYGLPISTKIYDDDFSTVLKQVDTTYQLGSAYTDRRVLGLPSLVEAYGRDASGLPLISKVSYSYDYDDNFEVEDMNQDVSPYMHDNGSHPKTLSEGRGNLTSVTRWDARTGYSSNPDYAITSTFLYNKAGSLVAKTSPWGNSSTRTVKLVYADNFNSTPPGATYAYPTSLVDPEENSSTVKYRYDIGANIEATSPAPDDEMYGKTSKRKFNDDGRLEEEAVFVNATKKFYTIYDYSDTGVNFSRASTLIDGNSNGPDANDEVTTETITDGAGRILRTRTEHPGSTGGWSAVKTTYDILGRVATQSVPTEVDNSWDPDGEDSTWVFSSRAYDWMGRVIRTIPAGSDGMDEKDTLIAYAGCGCAGGQTITVQGPEMPRTDTSGDARRKQKVYHDILGRAYKTETFEWDGTSVYTSSELTFNGRDQVLESEVTDYSETSPIVQLTTATYDGHGRLETQHVPQQDEYTNTTFSYYKDDSLHVKTDARGATQTYVYDNRGRVTSVTSDLPEATNTTRKNFALAVNAGKPTASSTYDTNFMPSGAFDGNRKGNLFGTNGGWNDDTANSFPDSIEVAFDSLKSIDEINVVTLSDNPTTDGEPTLSSTFTSHGITDYFLQYWDGSSWQNISGASATSNDKVWRQFTFSAIQTTKVKLIVSAGLNNYSRVIELEAWGTDAAPPVDTTTTYTYDDLGNRLTMTDNNGSNLYEYDSLSRMISETRSFTDTLASAPETGNGFKLQYTYTMAGGLKSITDPYDDVITYGHDEVGRLTSVTGSTFGSMTNYASGAAYTARGSLKSLTYGNGLQMTTEFNASFQPESYLLDDDSTPIMEKEYEYYKDGSLKYVEDKLNPIFHRLNVYDHVGRVKDAKSGLEAQGTPVTTDQDTDLPYRQAYTFNGFGNLLGRDNLHWGTAANIGYTYLNNRITNADWEHDADGRVTRSAAPDDPAVSSYDGRGLLVSQKVIANYSGSFGEIERFYDGDGREVKRKKIDYTPDPYATQWPYGSWTEKGTTYYIRSSVLGGAVVSEALPSGAKEKSFVMAGGAKIATQNEYQYSSSNNEAVTFDHFDRIGMSFRSSAADGTVPLYEGQYAGAPAEMDPMGGNMGIANPYAQEIPEPPPSEESYPFFPVDGDFPMYADGQQVRCTLDGMSVGCSLALSMLGNSANVDPKNTDMRILSQLGIFAAWIENDVDPYVPTPSPGVTLVETSTPPDGHWEYLVSSSLWQSQLQPTLRTPASTKPTPAPPQQKSSCDSFADKVAQLSSFFNLHNYGQDTLDSVKSGQVQKFMDALAKWGTEFSAATSASLAGHKLKQIADNPYTEHNGTGFKSNLKDDGPGGSPNQVRHSIGGFIAGYINALGDTRLGHYVMTRREDDSPEGSRNADLALNALTIPKGGELANSSTGYLAASSLSNWIRDNLCAAKPKEAAGNVRGS